MHGAWSNGQGVPRSGMPDQWVPKPGMPEQRMAEQRVPISDVDGVVAKMVAGVAKSFAALPADFTVIGSAGLRIPSAIVGSSPPHMVDQIRERAAAETSPARASRWGASPPRCWLTRQARSLRAKKRGGDGVTSN